MVYTVCLCRIVLSTLKTLCGAFPFYIFHPFILVVALCVRGTREGYFCVIIKQCPWLSQGAGPVVSSFFSLCVCLPCPSSACWQWIQCFCFHRKKSSSTERLGNHPWRFTNWLLKSPENGLLTSDLLMFSPRRKAWCSCLGFLCRSHLNKRCGKLFPAVVITEIDSPNSELQRSFLAQREPLGLSRFGFIDTALPHSW